MKEWFVTLQLPLFNSCNSIFFFICINSSLTLLFIFPPFDLTFPLLFLNIFTLLFCFFSLFSLTKYRRDGSGGSFWEDFELTPCNHMRIVMVVRMLLVQYIIQVLLYCWFGKNRAMDKYGCDCSHHRERARTLQGEVTGKQLRLTDQLYL